MHAHPSIETLSFSALLLRNAVIMQDEISRSCFGKVVLAWNSAFFSSFRAPRVKKVLNLATLSHV
jgi:hypothetical protein